MKRILIFSAAVAILSILAAAQSTKPSDTKTPEVRNVPAQRLPASDGAANFKAYCAACHGTSGKGNGPAASAMTLPPTDLTKLAANTGGKYPAMHVKATILNADTAAHGSKEMPVWGPVFRSIGSGEQSDVELRVANLTKYIETLQAK